MKNSKLTKLVALASVLLVSVATLAGSTVAWFTDTEEVVNTIQSGDLDVELQYKVVESDGTLSTEWLEVEDNKQIFKENALYEPGYTEFVLLKVRNAGNLALQYRLSVDATNTEVGASVGQENPTGGDYDVAAGEEIYLSDHLKLAAFPIAGITETTTEADADTAVENQLYTDGKVTRSTVRELIGDTVTDGSDGTEIPYITEETRGLWTGKSTTQEATLYEALIQYVEKGDTGSAIGNIENIELWPETADKKGETYDIYGLVLYMPEETTNEANNRKVDDQGAIINPEIQLGIKLEAAQVVEQADSFDDQYDADATYDGNVYSDTTSEEYKANVGGAGTLEGFAPDAIYSENDTVVTVYSADQLYAAGQNTTVQKIILGNSIDMSELTVKDDYGNPVELHIISKTLDLNSKTLNLQNVNIYPEGTVTFIGNGEITGEDTTSITARGSTDKIVIDGVKMNVLVSALARPVEAKSGTVNLLKVTTGGSAVISGTAHVDELQSVTADADGNNITINGGTVSILNSRSLTKATINGGTIGSITVSNTSGHPEAADITIEEGAVVTGNISVTRHGIINITGGSFGGKITAGVYIGSDGATDKGIINISGGYFSGELVEETKTQGESTITGIINITGGYFTDAAKTSAESMLADGFTWGEVDSNGYYSPVAANS